MPLKRKRTDDEEDKYDFIWGNNMESRVNKTTEVHTRNNNVYTIGTEIHFNTNIDRNSIQEIIRQITELVHNHKIKSIGDPEKLTISYVVDSPGGSANSILKFVDFIRLTKQKYPFVEFISIITGMVASAGTIMAIVADKRYMTKNSHTMIHELSSGNSGKYSVLISHITFLKKLHDLFVNIYCEKTKKLPEEIENLLDNETWFSSSEYLANGFVDEIK